MKTLNNKWFMIAVGLMFMASSCVSTRKFNTAQNEIIKLNNQNKENKDNVARLEQQAKNYETNSAMLKQMNDDLTKKYASLEKTSSNKINESDMALQRDEKALSDLSHAVMLEKKEVSSIKQQLCDALKCFTPDEVSVQERNGELYVMMYDKLLFPTAGTIVNKRGKEALAILSKVLKDNSMKIMVEGHTDAVPIHNERFADNWDLSVIRATNVLRVLTKQDKLDPARIVASGKGKNDPFYDNKTAKGRSLNRRTDIVLIPKLDELYSLINQNNNSGLIGYNR